MVSSANDDVPNPSAAVNAGDDTNGAEQATKKRRIRWDEETIAEHDKERGR